MKHKTKNDKTFRNKQLLSVIYKMNYYKILYLINNHEIYENFYRFIFKFVFNRNEIIAILIILRKFCFIHITYIGYKLSYFSLRITLI